MKRLTSLAFWLLSAFALAQPGLAAIVVSGTHVLVSGGHPVFSTPFVVVSNPIRTAANASYTFAASGTLSYSTLPSSGDGVVVAVGLYLGGSAGSVTSIADNQGVGNTYTKITSSVDSGNQADEEMWWCPSIGATSGTFTITVTLSASEQIFISSLELSGITTVDKTGINSATSGTSITVTASGANTSATDFVVAVVQPSFGASALSHPPTTTNTDTYTDFAFCNCLLSTDAGYYTASVTETSNASWTWTTSQPNVGLVVTFH